MQNIKITSAEEFAFHALISLIAAALLAGITAGAGIVYGQGVNPGLMITAGIAGFVSAFSTGFLAFRNNPETKQAESDAVSQIQAIANRLEANTGQQLLSHLQGVFGIIQQATQQQPTPVVVNNHIPAAVSVPAELSTTELAPLMQAPAASTSATQASQFKLVNLTSGNYTPMGTSVSPDSIPLAALGKQQ